tara:strand:- start:214 stop:711 length:498 start_codon:yes stop_codon:yes gene_type:complete
MESEGIKSYLPWFKALTISLVVIAITNVVELSIYISQMQKVLELTDINPTPQNTLKPEELFSNDPIERLMSANFVAYVSFEAVGDKTLCIVRNIIKRTPDFSIQVGDEYNSCSFYPKLDTSYGEGAIITAENPQGYLRNKMPIYSGRIAALGDIPITNFLKEYAK